MCELAQNLQVDEEELTMALEAGSEVESLHRPVFQSEGQEVRLMDKLPQEKEQEEQIVNHMLLSQLLTGLEKEERRLLYLRYFAEKTQTGRKGTWHFAGSGFQDGKTDFTKFKRTNLTGMRVYIFQKNHPY